MAPSHTKAQRLAAAAAAFIVNTVMFAAQIYAGSFYGKTSYHTSALTGEMWVEELMNGHPDCIKSELGMRLHVFVALVQALAAMGLKATQYISLEHVAIFLYTCVTGLSIRHVGERFQQANATISKYVSFPIDIENAHLLSSQRSFCTMLYALSSPPFYTSYVWLPTINDPIPFEIATNPKFFPFFEGALGAMGGAHINCCPPLDGWHLAQDWKGGFQKIHWLVAASICTSSISSVEWMAVQLMLVCVTMPGFQILQFQRANITWQMLGLACATHFWSHIEVCDITLQNGAVLTWGKYSDNLILLPLILNSLDLQQGTSCTICIMHQPTMLLNESLGCSSDALLSWCMHQNITWRFKPVFPLPLLPLTTSSGIMILMKYLSLKRYLIPSQVQLYTVNLELGLPDIQKFYELLPDVIELLKQCGPVTRQ